jgi:predicted mannosyl-3-phosphoglycerate phosphatase (HAD superfamily)
MNIYMLTQWGKKATRNIRNPDSPAFRVLYTLDKMGHGTKEQIAAYTGLPEGQVSLAINRLKRYNPPLVQEA